MAGFTILGVLRAGCAIGPSAAFGAVRFVALLTLLGMAAVTSARQVERGPLLQTPRAAHQVTPLADGSLLLTGGCSGLSCSPAERTSEIYQPALRRWVKAAPMADARIAHVSAPLPGGAVLVAGGWTGTAATASAEIYDAGRDTFVPTRALATPRMDATATPLPDGSVLVIGGATATNQPVASAERFDPVHRAFYPAGVMAEARVHHAAVRLDDGRVLVTGGLTAPNQGSDRAELWDPATSRFRPAAAMARPRCKHAAVRLRDGRAMVIGGSPDCGDTRRMAETEIFDPRTGRFSAGPTLHDARYKIVGAAVVLPDGRVVVAGDAAAAEIWVPGQARFARVAGGPGRALAFSTASLLPHGGVLIAGGYDDDIRPTPSSWVLQPGQ
ncbi:MAG: kelch repeat-containing protein [Acidobacteriota bacterium]